MLNQIINADCFDVFPEIPDGSIDMIFCDLPYGTTRSPWDSVLPFDRLWPEYERIINLDTGDRFVKNKARGIPHVMPEPASQGGN